MPTDSCFEMEIYCEAATTGESISIAINVERSILPATTTTTVARGRFVFSLRFWKFFLTLVCVLGAIISIYEFISNVHSLTTIASNLQNPQNHSVAFNPQTSPTPNSSIEIWNPILKPVCSLNIIIVAVQCKTF